MNYFWLFLCFIFSSNLISQTKIKGQVIDFDNAVPIAFASVTYNNETIASDWEGKFYVLLIDEKLPIKINYKGFYEKIIYASNKTSTLTVKLVNDLNAKKKEIYSEIEVNNIINAVIENKKNNDPSKALSSFQYKNYEYLQVTANPDSISSKIDTIFKKKLFGKPQIKLDSTNYKYKKVVEKQR